MTARLSDASLTLELSDSGSLTIEGPFGIIRLGVAEAQTLRAFLNNHHRLLKPLKNWVMCPYEHHSNDCDCEGAGGDR